MSRLTENLKKWANAPGPRLSRYAKTKFLSVIGIDPEQLSEDEIFALTTLAKEIPAELDQRKLLKEIIERAVTLLSGTTGGVYLLDAAEEDLKIEEDWGGSKSIRGHRLKIGQGLCGWVAQKKKARRVEDYSKFPDRSPNLDPADYGAVIAAPLATKANEILGVLYVTDSRKGIFTGRHEEVLTLFASQAGLVIDRAQNLAQLELLTNVFNRISSALTLRDLLEQILDEALQAVGTDEGSVMVVNPSTNKLKIEAWLVGNKPVEVKDHREFAINEGIAGHVAFTKEPYVCADSESDEHFVKSPTGRNPPSILSVPIVSNNSLLCILNTDNQQDHFFKKGHVRLLSKLANQVAIAIESQRLRDFSSSLTTLGSTELYLRIVESALYLTNADLSALFIRPEGTQKLERVAVFPQSGESLDPRIRKSGLTAKIFENKNHDPEVINDAQTNPLVKQSLKDRGVKALMGVQLYLKLEHEPEDKVLGVLYVSTKEDRKFTQRDAQILQALATQAAVSIANSWLYSYQQSLTSRAFDAILSIDRYGKIKEFNDSARTALGYEKDEDIRKLVPHASILFKDPLELWKICRHLLKEGNAGRLIDYWTDLKKKREGAIVSIRLSATLFEDGIVVFFRDQSQIDLATQYIQQIHQVLDEGAIAPSKDLNWALNTIVDNAREQFTADPVCLYFYNHEADQVQLPPIRRELYHENMVSADDGQNWIIRRLINRARDALRDGGPKEIEIVTDNTPGDPILGHEFAEREKICATAAWPLVVGKEQRVVGVLFLNFRSPHSFTEPEKDSIKRFATDAANLIHLAHSSHVSQRKAKQFYALQRAVRGLTSLDCEASLRGILAKSLDMTDAEFGVLGVVKQHSFEPFLLCGPDEKGKPKTNSLVSGRLSEDGFFAQVLHSHEIRTSEAAFQVDVSSLPSGHPPMRNLLAVPITFKGTPLGILYVANKLQCAEFDDEDSIGLQQLAALAALCIKSSVEDPQDRENIELAYVLFSRFARNLRKTGLKLTAELSKLRLGLLGSTHELQLSKVSKLLNELNSTGYLVEVEEAAIARENFNFSDFLNRLLESLSLDGTIRLEPSIESVLLVNGSQLLLDLMLRILLDNAITAIKRSGKPGSLRVYCFTRGDQIFTRIEDTGDGIPPEIAKDLFKRPLKLDDGIRYASFVAAKIVNSHKGEIEISKTARDEGTTIVFKLPQAARY